MGQHDVPPSEFWGMSPSEVWLVVSAKTPERRVGSLTGEQFDRLAERYRELEAQGVNLL